jgi:hypothetical protein
MFLTTKKNKKNNNNNNNNIFFFFFLEKNCALKMVSAIFDRPPSLKVDPWPCMYETQFFFN